MLGYRGKVLVCRDTGRRSLYVGIQGEVLVCRDTGGRSLCVGIQGGGVPLEGRQ